MVSQRQRLARKRFREANPDLLAPNPPPAAAAAASENKKRKTNAKKSLSKRKKQPLSAAAAAVKKTGRSKHPLRLPGMRPGERCFICKSGDHVAKACPEKALWDKNKICLLCRERGHSLKNCPEKSGGGAKKFCYNCGESGHSLSKCPKPIEDGGTKFASCFICKEQGHLSKNCPENRHGIYPKGGCCKICGGVTHLAKHCPNKGKQDLPFSVDNDTDLQQQDEDHAVCRGGDDLEDDFIEEEPKPTKSSGTKRPNSKSASAASDGEKKTHAKSKVKQAPKVVNFFG